MCKKLNKLNDNSLKLNLKKNIMLFYSVCVTKKEKKNKENRNLFNPLGIFNNYVR